MRRRDFLHLSLNTLAASILPQSLKSAALPNLRELAAHRKLLFGSAVSDSQLHRPDFTALLLDQCSILVPENQMKWRATQPEQAR
ncbi:MAG: endo-1,4-beta-xylanase, partial [Candidatus Acidiferrum sp.]